MPAPADWLSRHAALVASRMSRRRYLHSVGVMHLATVLAKRFGADPDAAAFAGLLHDVRKEAPHEELRAELEAAGWDACPLRDDEAKLWHAWAGEVFVRRELGVDDEEILGAIRLHPTGCAEMTPLQSIIFLADYIEPTRPPRPSLEPLRQLARENLDQALLFALREKTAYVANNGHRAAHPWSLAALRAVEARLGAASEPALAGAGAGIPGGRRVPEEKTTAS